MPAILPEGLTIAAVLPREDPLDAIVLPVRLLAPRTTAGKPDTTYEGTGREGTGPEGTGREGTRGDGTGGDGVGGSTSSPSYVVSGFSRTLDDLARTLGQSPIIGTGSVRRIAQLTRLFPGARFTPIRGNLDTRLRKLDEGEHDALVLAAAGLRRLGFASRISIALPADACIPAPGQGIVAIEIRDGDESVRSVIQRINDEAAGAALTAERALVEALGGGCQTPVGALATMMDGETLQLNAVVVALDGSRAVRGEARGTRSEAGAIGRRVAAQLIADGADAILEEARRAQGAVEGIQP
jgi:porphobilinogen deaminase